MNVKTKCIRCKKEMVEGFKMILQMGPRGFRRYATCDVCAAKLEKANGRNRYQRINV
jgi:hypothetical protein